jgi:hypothetical protein
MLSYDIASRLDVSDYYDTLGLGIDPADFLVKVLRRRLFD